MLVISVRDNENKKWKGKGEKTKTKRNKEMMQAIVNMSELNGFVLCLS